MSEQRPPDETDLEAFERDYRALSRRYEFESADVEPSAELDAPILAAAHRAVAAGPTSRSGDASRRPLHRSKSWKVPLGIAASLVLTGSIGVALWQDRPEVFTHPGEAIVQPTTPSSASAAGLNDYASVQPAQTASTAVAPSAAPESKSKIGDAKARAVIPAPAGGPTRDDRSKTSVPASSDLGLKATQSRLRLEGTQKPAALPEQRIQSFGNPSTVVTPAGNSAPAPAVPVNPTAKTPSGAIASPPAAQSSMPPLPPVPAAPVAAPPVFAPAKEFDSGPASTAVPQPAKPTSSGPFTTSVPAPAPAPSPVSGAVTVQTPAPVQPPPVTLPASRSPTAAAASRESSQQPLSESPGSARSTIRQQDSTSNDAVEASPLMTPDVLSQSLLQALEVSVAAGDVEKTRANLVSLHRASPSTHLSESMRQRIRALGIDPDRP